MLLASLGSWDNNNSNNDNLERIILISIIGYELKDFFYSKIDNGFLAHHLFTFAGCIVCLLSNSGYGMITLNAINAEFGSSFSNLFTLHKNPTNLILFMIGTKSLSLSLVSHNSTKKDFNCDEI